MPRTWIEVLVCINWDCDTYCSSAYVSPALCWLHANTWHKSMLVHAKHKHHIAVHMNCTTVRLADQQHVILDPYYRNTILNESIYACTSLRFMHETTYIDTSHISKLVEHFDYKFPLNYWS